MLLGQHMWERCRYRWYQITTDRLMPIRWIVPAIGTTSIAPSVAGRIGIVATSRAGVGRSVGCCSISRGPSGPGIHRATKRRAPSGTGKRHRRHRPADDVDEESRPAIAAGEVTFEDLNIERQFFAFE